LESSQTVTAVTASVKKVEEGRPRPYFRKPIASVCHVTPGCEHALLLYECSFNFVFVSSVMHGRIKQCVCIKFCVKLSKSTTETLEMLCEAFGEHSLRQQFLNGIRVSRPVECQMKMKVQGDQAPTKQQKMLKKLENSSTKTITEQSMSSQLPLGSVMEFSRRS
jgi:hypothetical protein